MNNDLYKEICRDPEDDTLRLAYADWLDENGDPDRAEFVRVQYSLGVWVGRGHHRESALLAAHPEWSWLPCEKCRGRTWGTVSIGEFVGLGTCQTCHGTGDLFFTPRTDFHARTADEWGRDLAGTTDPRTVTFARGFPDSVTCTLAEAFGPDGTPTPWACEVVRLTPVTRFVLTNKTPAWDRHGDGMASWYNGTDVMLPAVITAAVPGVLLAEMTGEISVVAPPRLGKWFHDVPTAVDALALAAGRLVRRHVYGEVTQ